MRFRGLNNKFLANNTLEKDKLILIIRWIIVFLVFMWWWATGNNPIGVALVLVLSSTTLIRMQFSDSFLFILVEEAICFISIFYWPGSTFALMLPAFESGVLGLGLTFLPVALIIFSRQFDINLGMILILNLMAFSIGYIIKAWGDREKLYLRAADRERKQRYEVEQLKNDLLTANNENAKLVEATERNRIAQELHDSVGHEIAGALIALQTYKKLQENNDLRAGDMFESVLKRVEASSIKLRETVYKLRPDNESGALRLQKLCEDFSYCDLKYRFVGDITRVPAIAWVILEPCLKEALTNIVKYSKATEASVRFDITEYIIRMNIKDNGIGAKDINPGLGISGIRERIRAAGGTVSIDSTEGFMITCILPIDSK